jgi:chorismate lyase / 3-hydroxybenzoate synthase
MRAHAGLRLEYVTLAEYEAAGWSDVLGVATFYGDADPRGAPRDSEIPLARVATQVLAPSGRVCEVWRCGQPAESGRHGRVHFRRTEEMLFGCIALNETEGRATAAGEPGAFSPRGLHAATSQVYQEICATIDAQSCPHLLRVWNYLPDINRESSGTERYRQFNTARQQALRACGRAHTGQVPAASALGSSADSPLVVYFLAGRMPPTFVENPRQVSAYHYPRQYGAHSPAFSRATLLQESAVVTLFVSGTASIVGHHSLHAGDAAAQTHETLANIEALLEQANRAAPGAQFSLRSLACKAYVRRPADLPVIQAELSSALGPEARILYLRADICRQDLLVEVEATAMKRRAGAA